MPSSPQGTIVMTQSSSTSRCGKVKESDGQISTARDALCSSHQSLAVSHLRTRSAKWKLSRSEKLPLIEHRNSEERTQPWQFQCIRRDHFNVEQTTIAAGYTAIDLYNANIAPFTHLVRMSRCVR